MREKKPSVAEWFKSTLKSKSNVPAVFIALTLMSEVLSNTNLPRLLEVFIINISKISTNVSIKILRTIDLEWENSDVKIVSFAVVMSISALYSFLFHRKNYGAIKKIERSFYNLICMVILFCINFINFNSSQLMHFFVFGCLAQITFFTLFFKLDHSHPRYYSSKGLLYNSAIISVLIALFWAVNDNFDLGNFFDYKNYFYLLVISLFIFLLYQIEYKIINIDYKHHASKISGHPLEEYFNSNFKLLKKNMRLCFTSMFILPFVMIVNHDFNIIYIFSIIIIQFSAYIIFVNFSDVFIKFFIIYLTINIVLYISEFIVPLVNSQILNLSTLLGIDL